MISIITATKRYGGIDIAYNSLRKQTHKDIEWIIADELYDERSADVASYVKDVKLKHLKPRPKEEGHVWNLAHAYNDALKRAEGELVVVLDDYIWIPANGLELFWLDYQNYGQNLYTGVGNKAPAPPVEYPQGHISIFGVEYNQVPQGISERDTRIDGRKEIVETNHSFFELNWSAFPLALAKELGGFDEESDAFYCGQDRNFALRASLNGARVFMDKRNESIGLYHQGFEPRPEDWEVRHYNKNPKATLGVLEGTRPVKLSYL